MFERSFRIGACAALLALGMLASAQAGDTWHRTTYMTFSGPVGLPGVTLMAGTYVFELAEPFVRTDIVRVRNRERSRVYLTAFTERTARPAGWPADRHIAFGEAPAGKVPPILVWYPTGEAMGHRFIYPDAR